MKVLMRQLFTHNTLKYRMAIKKLTHM